MRQTLFMIAVELYATFGIFISGPFAGVAVYYYLAILRPQYLWNWALPYDVPWSNYPAGAAIAGLFGYALGLIPLGEEKKDPFLGFSAIHIAFLAFALWVCLTYFTAVSQFAAWPWLLEYLTIFTMFFVSIFVVRTYEQMWQLYLVTTLPLLYLVYEVNSLYFFDGRLDIYHVGLGGLDNNGAGLMLAMGVPLALGAWEGTARWWRWGYVLAIPPILHAVLVSYSRGAMVSLIAVTPFLILRSKRRWQALFVTVMLASTIPYLAGNEIRARFFTVADYAADDSAQRRFGSWGSAIKIANDYPIFGVGIRNSNLLSYNYGADIEGRTIHSQFLQVLADEGYVGFSLYLVTLGTFFFGLRRLRKSLRGRTDMIARRTHAMANGIETSFIVFCVGGLFLSLEVFELPYLLILQAAQLSLITYRETHEAALPKVAAAAFPGGLPRARPAAAGSFSARATSAEAARAAGSSVFSTPPRSR